MTTSHKNRLKSITESNRIIRENDKTITEQDEVIQRYAKLLGCRVKEGE